MLTEISTAPRAADVLLTDGRVVTIRPVLPADEPALLAMYERTDPESLRMRFFAYSHHAGRQDVARLVRPPTREHMAVIAIERDQPVGVGCLEKSSKSGTAEFALFVDDIHHSEGVGTLLLEHLVAAARAAGYQRLRADVLTENSAMLHVLRDLGARVEQSSSFGTVDVVFSLTEKPKWQRAVENREGHAEHASLDRVLAPRSVAVVGAGADTNGIGHRILANIANGGFTGELYAVNRSGAVVCGIPGVTSLRDLATAPDLVVIAVPATAVPQVIDDCAAIGAYGAVIVSDGFAELGADGRRQQDAISARARAAGMRLVGPNCLGVVNANDRVRLNATFADARPMPGPVGLASQSGGVGLALLDYLTRRRIGLSTFVSMGNKADVSGNDLLMYWEQDAATKVCVLYLESFGNARKFARVASRVARTKPIIAVTAGRTVAGARGVRSHTAAAATPDVAIDALFRQAGVMRAGTLGEVMDIVSVVTEAPLPNGGRVAIVTNGGGPGALAADASVAVGLRLPELSSRTREKLAPLLPKHAATTNPVDITAGGSPDALANAARVLLDSDEIDSVIVVHTSLSGIDIDAVAATLAAVATDPLTKPLLAVFLGRPDVPHPLQRAGAGSMIPCFAFPEAAAAALATVTSYADWRRKPAPKPPALAGIHRRSARTIVAEFLRDHPDGGWLDTDVAAALAASYGIAVVPTHRAETSAQAVAAALRVGFPVVVKSAAGEVLHRTERSGVKLNLQTPNEVAAAVDAIQQSFGSGCPVVVQTMLAGGVETAVGIVNDPTVGPIAMVALGGIATDLLADRSFRMLPLSRVAVREQIRSLRGAPLLFGYRGAPPVDIKALENLVLRVGQLASETPELAELDLNPVLARPEGASAVDIKIRLMPSHPADPYLRRLSRTP
jgi:acyl-CoA synthetase (NDP forming)/GNAT superfamily N-acetyltransferase